MKVLDDEEVDALIRAIGEADPEPKSALSVAEIDALLESKRFSDDLTGEDYELD
jgi:hypothetical protein